MSIFNESTYCIHTYYIYFRKFVHQRQLKMQEYCVQFFFRCVKAWLMNASVKENIIFGKAFKPERYVDQS